MPTRVLPFPGDRPRPARIKVDRRRHVPPGQADSAAARWKSTCFAFGCGSAATALLDGLFNLFYVDVFVNVYQLSDGWFQWGQLLFAVWNAVNDPLFGWLNDRAADGGKRHASSSLVRRTTSIRQGGLAWAALSLLPWLPSGDSDMLTRGMHYVTALFVHDAMYTYVVIAHCALIADLTSEESARHDLNRARQLGSIAGTAVVFGSLLLYDAQQLRAFRLYALLCAALAGAAFWLCANGLCEQQQQQQKRVEEEEEEVEDSVALLPRVEEGSDGEHEAADEEQQLTVRRAIAAARQIFSLRSFQSFLIVAFIQCFTKSLLANFYPTVERQLLHGLSRTALDATRLSMLLLPQLLLVVLSPAIKRMGLQAFLQVVNVSKLALSGIMLISWLHTPAAMAAYVVVSTTLSGATFAMFDVVLADVIDEDAAVHGRRRALGTLVHGCQAMITKPAHSLAPMVGVALLRGKSAQHSPLWLLLVATPLLGGCLQTAAWWYYGRVLQVEKT